MKALKIITGRPLAGNNRDERELEVLHSLGCDVFVYCQYSDDAKNEKYPYSFIYEDISKHMAPIINHRGINARFSKWTEAQRLSRYEPDIISGHNLSGLILAWMVSLFCKKKPALVYDSHEFTLGEVSERSKREQKRVKRWEKFLLPKCAFVIEVNDSIADKVQEIYHLKERPIVVRSTPRKWQVVPRVIDANRKDYLNKQALSEDTFILLTLGRIVKDNGIFECINAIAKTTQTSLLVLGPFKSSRDLDNAREMVDKLGLRNRVVFHDALPQDEIWKLAGIADASLCLIKNNHQSFYLSLPNKLFESIQSLVPIIGSNFPEIKHIIEQYGVGYCCNPDSIQEIVDVIQYMKDNDSKKLLMAHLIRAKEDLCWEKERIVLENAYMNVIGNIKNS